MKGLGKAALQAFVRYCEGSDLEQMPFEEAMLVWAAAETGRSVGSLKWLMANGQLPYADDETVIRCVEKAMEHNDAYMKERKI